MTVDLATGRDRLVAATRELMLAVGTTDLDGAALAGVAERLEALVPGLRQRTLAAVPAPTYDESVGADSYLSAYHNPGLPPFEITFRDDRAHARTSLAELHQGPSDSVHGGIISYLMDTLLACLVQQQGRLCVTASLKIDYRARTPLRSPLDLEAQVREVRERSMLVAGSIAHEGRVTVQAEGLFVDVPAR